MKYLLHFSAFLSLLFLSTPSTAQISALARLLSAESKAASMFGRMESASTGIRSSAILGSSFRVEEYLLSSPSYSKSLSELESLSGNSFRNNPILFELNNSSSPFHTQLKTNNFITFNEKDDLFSMKSTLEKQFDMCAEVYRSVKKKRSLTEEDSLTILSIIYHINRQEIWKAQALLSAGNGGNGIIPPNSNTLYADEYNGGNRENFKPEAEKTESEKPEEPELDMNQDTSEESKSDRSSGFVVRKESEKKISGTLLTAGLVIACLMFWVVICGIGVYFFKKR